MPVAALEKLREIGMTVMECQFRALSKARDKDGDWIKLTFWVHPDECPNELFKTDLGTRMGIAMVQIREDEQPVEKPKLPFHEKPLASQVAIRCQDSQFIDWVQDAFRGLWHDDIQQHQLSGYPDRAERVIKRALNVERKRDIAESAAASVLWQNINERFEEDTRLPEKH